MFVTKGLKRAAPALVTAIAAPLIVIASLLIPATPNSPGEARHAAYGYPTHFATSHVDSIGAVITDTMTAQERRTYFPATVPFNPRDNPTSFEGVAFAESTGALAGVILLVLFVIRRARRQVRLGHRRVAGT